MLSLLTALWSTSFAADSAGETGTITGRVLNGGTGEYLRNAIISVVGTDISTAAEGGGYYRLSGVPAGAVRLNVTYTGLDQAEVTVAVPPGETVTQDFTLSSSLYDEELVKLGEYVVTSQREGNAKAIMEQRQAENQVKVISSDAMGNVSEGNVGEFLKLMPGINMDYVEADTRQMRIRGLNPKYANVLLDGAQVATSGSSNIGTGRGFEFEMLSIDAVETVELTKSPTADQPSAVAGTVNLRTRSAFDLEGRRINYNFGLSTNSLYTSLSKTEGWNDKEHYKIFPNYAFEFSDVFLDKKLGVTAGYAHNFTMAAQKHIWFFYAPFDADATNNDTEVPVVERLWFQDGPKPTERDSYNLRLDYRLSDNLTTTARVGYNTYDARFYNRTLSLRPNGQNGTATRGRVELIPNLAPGFSKTDQTVTAGRISIDSNQFMTKEGSTLVLASETNYKKGNFSADLGLHHSRAYNYYGNRKYGHFTDYSSSLSNISWRLTRPSPGSSAVTLTQLSGPDWKNPANYIFNGTAATAANGQAPDTANIGWHERQAKDQQWTARLDFKHDFSESGLKQVLRYGALTNLKVLDVKRYGLLTISPTGPDRVMGTADDLRPVQFVDPGFRSDWEFGGNTDGWPALSPWAMNEHYLTNPLSWVEAAGNGTQRLRNNWDFKERIDALYLSDTFKFGRLELAPGLRYERTTGSGKGFGATPTLNRFITANTKYDALLHYLHATWRLSDTFVLRGSYHTAITRADINNLVPGISAEDPNTNTITGSNPDLTEESSRTFNLTAEYYFEPVGVLSASVFRTEVDDRQFTGQEFTLGPDGYQGNVQYAGWRLRSTANLPIATTLRGVELDYNQQLSKLPGFLSGLGVFGNVTYVDYDHWEFYFNSPKLIRNAGIAYNQGRWAARLNLNWVGRILQVSPNVFNVATRTFSTNAAAPEYQKDRQQFDLNLEYQLSDRVTLFLDGRNIFNEDSTYSYRGREENFMRILQTGGIWIAGVKGRF